MKNKKKLLIGAIAAAVVVIIVVVICLIAGGNSGEEEYEADLYGGLGEIERIEYTYGSDPVVLIKEDGKWYWKNDKELTVDQEAVDFAISGFEDYLIIDILDEPGSLKEYGLKKPSYSIELEDTKGNTKVIYVGNSVGEDGMSYYAKEKGDDRVYIVTYDLIDTIDSLDIQRALSEQEDELYNGLIEEE